ncbi:MAG: Bug family tripartite tricarboxylate transporter substrate binding protein [Burkholderiales bacterium]
MKKKSCTAAIQLGLTLALTGNIALGQSFPSKPIRIVTSEIGGSSDLVSRLIANGIAGPMGQQVIIDNRPGGSIAGEAVLKSPPDGHTLIYYGNALWILPMLRKSVPYDTVRDFSPITLTVIAPTILVVPPALPIKSVKELVAMAKAQPGKLNYGAAASGTTTHLAAELFKSLASVDIVRITYKGNASAINDVLAGNIQMTFAPAGAVAQHIKSGRARALAVTNALPSVAYPDLPTVAAAGVAGFEAESIYGMWAPGKTPSAVISRLNQEITKVLKQPDITSKLFGLSMEVVASTPEQFVDKVKSEIVRMGKVITEAGIRDE